MINPRHDDIGRRVVFKPGTEIEDTGVIRGISKDFIFVQYRGQTFSQATRRLDLEWADVKVKEKTGLWNWEAPT